MEPYRVDEYSGETIKPNKSIYVPLMNEHDTPLRVIGVLCLQRCSIYEFTSIETSTLQAVAGRVAMHLGAILRGRMDEI